MHHQSTFENVCVLVDHGLFNCSERETCNSLRAKLSEVEENNEDMLADMERCRKKEKELLEFTGKISDKNAHLQSENSALETKVGQGLSVCNELTHSMLGQVSSKTQGCKDL